jgi:hypothetical protein
LTAPANGATFTAPATITLSATASDSDGTIAKVEFYNGATLLNADATAPYSLSWAPVAAGTYIVKAIAYDNSGVSTSSATATITVTGAANQPPTVTLTSPSNGTMLVAPASISMAATATDTDGTISKVEFYNGTTLLNTDTTSPYSYTWASVAAGTYTLKAVAYDNAGASASSTTATVTVGSALPNGQQAVDIGSPAMAGSTSFGNGTYTTKAGGAAIWNTADQFRFIYQQTSGDVDTVLHVASITAANSYSSAGVMIRETLAAGSKHAFVLLSAARGYSFNERIQTDGVTTGVAGGGPAPGWVKLTRRGSLFTAFVSADGQSWTQVGTTNVTMASSAYVGIAVTANSTTATTTAVVDSLSVVPVAAQNQSPGVTLTSPANGTAFTAPANVTMNATATDSDGTIAKVEFYNGTTLLNTDTTAPYSFTWSSVAAGTYTLKAIAYDNSGASANSATSTITVSQATSTPPTGIVFTASTDHATLVTRYELRIYASGANPSTATPITTSDLGKPTPDANNDITVDRAAFFSALAPGNYVAAVAAIGSGGTSISSGVAFSR